MQIREKLEPAIDYSLLTFGQLCKMKREQYGYYIHEVEKKARIFGLSGIERDKRCPSVKTKLKLCETLEIDFEAARSCRKKGEPVEEKKIVTIIEQPKVVENNRISTIILSLKEIMNDVQKINYSGKLANHLKEEALIKMGLAYECLDDIAIIENFI